MWREDNDISKWLKHEDKEYPPRIIMDVIYDEKKAMADMITFTLHCTGVQRTIHSKGYDKQIYCHAKSHWFIDNGHQGKYYC